MVTEEHVFSRLVDLGVAPISDRLVTYATLEAVHEVKALLATDIPAEMEEVVIDRAVGAYLLSAGQNETLSAESVASVVKSIKEGDTAVEYLATDPQVTINTYARTLRSAGADLIRRFRVIVW